MTTPTPQTQTPPANVAPSAAEPRRSSWLARLGHLAYLLRQWVKRPFYKIYEKRLEIDAPGWKLPRHIGVVMDGNRRFARELGSRHVSWGHQRGAETLQEMLSWCYELEIPVVTVWSFSLENFQRDIQEVQALLQLFEDKTREMVHHADVHANGVRVRYIGKTELLPESLQEAIRSVEDATASYDKFHLNIAMAYGGRQEITDAFRDYLTAQAAEGKELAQVAEELDTQAIESHLYTSGLPEPDLIVRTSGEVRLSGFLLWQSCYSEFYFCDTHWPAFRKIDFLRALRSYDLRQRRFGR